jgi:hypothetical protein
MARIVAEKSESGLSPSHSFNRCTTVGLNAETKKVSHRADEEECLLTFLFIGHSFL